MDASSTIYFTISALIYTTLTTILFFTKKKVNKIENRMFKRLIIISILSMVTELMIIFTKDIHYIGAFIQKLFLVFIILWLSRFAIYTFIVTIFNDEKSEEENIKKYKKFYNIFLIINILLSIIILIAPIEFIEQGTAKYTSGLSVNIVYGITAVYMVIMFILLITHLRGIKKKGYLPVVSLLILLTMTAVIQSINPQILLTNAVFGLVIFLMYNTIENPDLKLINELNLAKLETEKANNSKTEFLKNMSHEIATPINKAKGMNYLNMESNDLTEIKENATIVDEYLGQLSDISKNIIDVIKLESNSLKLENQVYYPSKLLEEIKKLALTKIDNKNIAFKLKHEKLPHALYGDSPKIKHIITELITNAIKYTDKGTITLTVKSKTKGNKCILCVEVKDTGIGIKKSEQKTLFNYFSRADLDQNITKNGMGLGLSISKQLVEMMNGKITLKSELGKGSTFYFEIEQELMEVNK